MIRTYVEARRHAEPTSDPIDLLIADGETTDAIAEYVMMIMLFVGVNNTGIIACWMLIDLAIHQGWGEECKTEIRDLLARHLGNTLSSATLQEKLGAVPLSAWEDELPILDACIRESQRISLTTVPLRRNLGGEIEIDGKVVKPGDFLAYSMSDAHLNVEYYPDPYKYDPGRWFPTQSRTPPIRSSVGEPVDTYVLG